MITQTNFQPYLLYFIIALSTVRLIAFIINWRQLMKYKESTIDPYLAGDFDQTEFEDSQRYQYEKHSFKIVHSVFDFILDVCFWMLFWWVWVWNRIDGFMSTFALCADTPYINDITQAYLFAVTVILISMIINIPFSLYDTFVIEEKYGFNKTTKGTFLLD